MRTSIISSLAIIMALLFAVGCEHTDCTWSATQTGSEIKANEKRQCQNAYNFLITQYDCAKTNAVSRNQYINSAMYLIDVDYYNALNWKTSAKSGGDFAGDVTTTTLGIIGGATPIGSVSKLMSSISAVVSGTKTAFNSDVLLGSTLPALYAQMEQDRTTIRDQITKNMTTNGELTSINVYSLQAAIVDLNNYYSAGSYADATRNLIKSVVTSTNNTKSR